MNHLSGRRFTSWTTALFTLLVALGLALPSAAQDFTPRGLDIDGEAAGDKSGTSVSLSADGSTLAVGAINNDGSGSDAGHVRVYEWIGGAWIQQGLDIDGEAAGDKSGTSVSLSADGSTVAIGAINNDGNGSDSGHVRVYDWNGSAWTQRGLDIDGEASLDNSGVSVSLSADGDTVAIGANNNDADRSTSPGHVRVYVWTGVAWIQQGLDIDGEARGDQSGISVSVSADGSRVAIGAVKNNGNGNDSGHVRVYEWIGGAWIQQGLDIDGEAAGDNSGGSVSLSANGGTVAIGARLNDSSGSKAGHVRVYSWSGLAWIQQGLDIEGEASLDQSGISVSLSADGSTVAIGATKNSGNGTDAGHARVYAWNGVAWIQQGSDIDGEAFADQLGTSVSLSADGNTLAIGASFNDGTGSNAGHVRGMHASSDDDNDGVPDSADMCPATTADTMTLAPNQWGWFSGPDFTQGPSKGKGSGGSYSMTDTQGCSCAQIVEALGVGNGHLKKGCSNGVMDRWMRSVGAGKAGEAPLGTETPETYFLDSAYPNPFNPHTIIGFALPEAAHISLTVFDMMGRRVRVLADGVMPAGTHTAAFEAGGLPSGSYLVRLDTPAARLTRMVQLIK